MKKFANMILGAVATVYLGITFALCFTGVINLSGTLDVPKSFEERLQYTLRFIALEALWQFINTEMMIIRRLLSGAWDPLNGGLEHLLTREAKILQNTFEQFILSVVAQLIFVACEDGELIAKVIPWVNMQYFLGRISFAIGYPNFRGFGFILGFLPTVIMIVTSTVNLIGILT